MGRIQFYCIRYLTSFYCCQRLVVTGSFCGIMMLLMMMMMMMVMTVSVWSKIICTTTSLMGASRTKDFTLSLFCI